MSELNRDCIYDVSDEDRKKCLMVFGILQCPAHCEHYKSEDDDANNR